MRIMTTLVVVEPRGLRQITTERMIKMDKRQVLDLTKLDMVRVIKEITLDNLPDVRGRLDQYVGFLEHLKALHFEDVVTVTEMTAKAVPSMADGMSEIGNIPEPAPKDIFDVPDTPTVKETETASIVGKTFVFKKLTTGGGILPALNDYYIPQKMSLDMKLADGDTVKVMGEENLGDKGLRYSFQIFKRNPDAVPDHELKMCIIERVFNEYVITRTATHGDITVGGKAQTLIITKQDEKNWRIKEHDVVDIVFDPTDRNAFAKITKKHRIEPLNKQQPATVKPTNKLKQDEPVKDKEEDLKALIAKVKNPDLFKSKSILVMGGAVKERQYREMLEPLGCRMEILSGKEHKTRITAHIKRADVVVIVSAYISHDASGHSVTGAKRYEKPFILCENMGNQSFLSACEKALERTMKEVVTA